LSDEIVRLTVRRVLREWRGNGDLRLRLYAALMDIARGQARSVATLPPARDAAKAAPDRSLAPFTAAWARLDWSLREPLVLVGLERLSYEQAAEVLGCTHDALMARLTRGRDALAAIRAMSEPGQPPAQARRASAAPAHLRLVK
jgi:RNA polymerase sigma-70 factor (ECF subfamily)